MKRVGVAGLVCAVLLAGCFPDPGPGDPGSTPDPLDPPTSEPARPAVTEWTTFINDIDGVEVLPRSTFPAVDFDDYQVVQADSATTAQELAEAVDAHAASPDAPDTPLTLAIIIDVEGGQSVIRHVDGATPPEAWELFAQPLPEGAAQRVIGFADKRGGDPHHTPPLPREHVPWVWHFGDDPVRAALGTATALDGHRYAFQEGRYNEPLGNLLGSTTDYRETSLDEIHAMARNVQVIRDDMEIPVQSFAEALMKVATRSDAVEVARALPGNRWIVSGGDFYLSPEHEYPLTSPTREEITDWAEENPGVEVMATIGDSLRLDFNEPGGCDPFLADPPAWTGRVNLTCTIQPGSSYGVEADLADALRAAPFVRDAVPPGGRVTVHRLDGPVFITASTYESIESAAAGVRLVPLWEGERKVSLRLDSDDFGATLDFRSTSTGRASGESSRKHPSKVEEAHANLRAAWDASATS